MPPDSIAIALENGYSPARSTPLAGVIGLQRMAWTWGLFVGIDYAGYVKRYCYQNRQDALMAFNIWDGDGDPPGPWIVEKPGGRLGPGAIAPEPGSRAGKA